MNIMHLFVHLLVNLLLSLHYDIFFEDLKVLFLHPQLFYSSAGSPRPKSDARPSYLRLRLPSDCRNKADAYGPAGPKHLLLVDDVFTTGSTLHACYAALREVFPPSVRISVATLAFVGEA